MPVQPHKTHKSTNILPVGSSRAAPYLAFGDDSRFKNTLVFAVVIIPRTRLRQVETRLARLKKEYSIPDHIQLHCRTLPLRDMERASRVVPGSPSAGWVAEGRAVARS